jgi:hypothetical protein
MLVVDFALIHFKFCVASLDFNQLFRGSLSSCTMQSNEASSSMEVDTMTSRAKYLPPKPKFRPLKPHEMASGQVQFRKVSVPPSL